MSESVKEIDDDSIDLSAMRQMVEQCSSSYHGLKGKDIDWFLRDSRVQSVSENGDLAHEPELAPTPEKKEHKDPHPTTAHPPNGASIKPAESPRIVPSKSADSATTLEKTRSRSSSLSSQTRSPKSPALTPLAPPGGFFNKLKGKFHRAPEQKESIDPLVNKPFPKVITSPTSSMTSLPPADFKSGPNGDGVSPTPKIDEYVKFYKQKEVSGGRRSSLSRRSSMSSMHSSHSQSNPGFANPFEGNYSTNALEWEKEKDKDDDKDHGKFSFIRRKSSVSAGSAAPPVLPSQALPPITANESEGSLNSSVDFHPSFNELKPLKRVAFHSRTFLIDPPQQIPSRAPRKGNVEVTPTGIKINPLTEEDKLAIEKSQSGQGGGMVVGGSGSLGVLTMQEREDVESDEESDVEVDDGEMINPPEDAEPEVAEEDTAVDKHAKSLGIDKPMVSHHHYNADGSYNMPVEKMALDVLYTRCCHLREILPIPSILKQIPKGSMAPLPLLQIRNPAPTLIEIQTFADFIRIAPIICVSFDGVSLSLEQFKILLSAMSAKKQLEQLSLRNTPIDNEGWSLLCWFLSRNTVLNRLDITQCPSLAVNVLKRRKKKTSEESKKFEVDLPRMVSSTKNRSDMDWSLFVATLIARGGMEDLILTGCCITDIDIFEKLITLAVSKKTCKLGLAYNQLTAPHLKIIVENWLFQDFALGLDLGYNDFSNPEMLKLILTYSKTPGFSKVLARSSLTFLSLNATNILFTDDFKVFLETVLLRFPRLKYLDFSNNPQFFEDKSSGSTQDSLSKTKSLDSNAVSSVKEADGKPHLQLAVNESKNDNTVISYMVSKLPMFPILVRLHLENNNLSSHSIILIAEILPFCKNLGYFSLLGNNLELSAGSALIQALKNSRSLITLECDYDRFPDFFKEKIGLYSMRNMERLLKKEKDNIGVNKTSTSSADQESETLTEQLNTILKMKAHHELDLNSPEVQSFVARARKVRHDLKQFIDDLLKVQLRGELNLEGKEALIRFIFIDSSIEKGLMLIDISLADEEHPHSMVIFGAAEKEKSTAYDPLERQFSEEGAPAPSNDLLARAQDTSLDPSSAAKIGGGRPSISPLANSRSSSRLNLQSLDRQEGSVLKLSKLHDTHTNDPNYKYLFNSLDSLSGEQIRRKLLGINYSDLDKIMEYVGKLKEQGISLENLFQNGEGDLKYADQMKHDGLEMNDIKRKLHELASLKDETEEETKKDDSTKKDVAKKATPVATDAVEGKDSKATEDNGKEVINEAYDEVLSKITSRK